MKIIGYLLLFLLAFVGTVIWKFPAAGVLPHVNTHPIQINGVDGSVWSGVASHVIAPPPAILVNNLRWRFKPERIFSGNAAVHLDFEVLGGEGDADVFRNLAGDISVQDGNLNVPAKSLEQFLPLPVAEFGGNVIADIVKMEIENNLLKTTRGSVVWRQASVTGAVNAQLGQVVLDVVPETQGDQLVHKGKLSNKDGQLDINGDFQLDQVGNYRADVRLKPNNTTPPELNGMLGAVGRRASDGSYRIRNNGNIRELM